MRVRVLALAVLALVVLAASPAAADTEIRTVGDRVEVRAQGAPLAEVLDRLARQTGMKLVFEGPAPRGRVSFALPAMNPAEAVLAALEGQGLTYAMRFDPTGSRIEMLIVVSGGGASSSASAGATPPRPDLRAPEHEATPEPEEEEPEPPPQAPRIDPDRMEREKEEGRQELRRPPNFPFGPGGPTVPPGPGGQNVPFGPTGPAVPLVVPPPGTPNPNVVGPRPVPSPVPQH